MSELLLPNEVYAITGAAMDVYNTLGPGFLEAVYQEALELELINRRIPFVPQQELHINYKGHYFKKTYITDFLCFDQIVVEIKAIDALSPRRRSTIAQLP